MAVTIGDTVWFDKNKNWKQDSGEEGISDIRVELYDAKTNLIESTKTDSEGYYEFDNVKDKRQFVRVVVPKGLASITPSVIEIWPDKDSYKVNFGLAKKSSFTLTGNVWNDSNQDWEKDANEHNLSNIIVSLYQESNQETKKVQTDTRGNYKFTNLGEGEYRVSVEKPIYAKVVTRNDIDLWLENNRSSINFGLLKENPIVISNKRKLLPPLNDKIYFSAFPGFGASEDIVDTKTVKSFEKLATKNIVWAPFSQHWFKGMAYPKKQVQAIHDAGVMPYVRFLPRSNLKQREKEKVFTLDKIIAGEFDPQLRAWAKGAKEHNIPLIMDFGVEMNGDWFSWSGIFNGADKKDGYGDPKLYDGPERYRDAYRHIIDLFRAENVNHITWFFHPNILDTPTVEWNKAKYYYPGDDYIDWIGFSLYGPFFPADYYWDTFPEVLEVNYKRILEISKNKPFALSEMGVTDHHTLGSKKRWLDDAFATMFSKKFLNFRAFTYWNEDWDNNGSLAALKIDSSPEALDAFRTAVQNDKITSQKNMSK